MYFTTMENSSLVYFLQNLLSLIRMDRIQFYLLNPHPHSEKQLDLDPQKIIADPQPCSFDLFFRSISKLITLFCPVLCISFPIENTLFVCSSVNRYVFLLHN